MQEEHAKELLKNREEAFMKADSIEEKPNLGKVAIKHHVNMIDTTNVPEIGWKNIPLESLPSKGLFYPVGTTINIKMAHVKEIRHFSSIDEDDFIDGDEKLHYIIEQCTRVNLPGVARSSWKDLQDIDRFYIIFCIRELTFIEGENQLIMNVSCSSCGNVDEINLTKNNLNYYNIDERLMKYYDPTERSFVILTKDGDKFPLYLPTLGTAIFIKNYVKNKIQNREFYDKSFIKMAPFLFKDWRSLNEQSYKAKSQETFEYGHKKLSILSGIIDALTKSISTDITHTCTSCSSEVTAPINFQGGVKSLFLYTNVFDELA